MRTVENIVPGVAVTIRTADEVTESDTRKYAVALAREGGVWRKMLGSGFNTDELEALTTAAQEAPEGPEGDAARAALVQFNLDTSANLDDGDFDNMKATEDTAILLMLVDWSRKDPHGDTVPIPHDVESVRDLPRALYAALATECKTEMEAVGAGFTADRENRDNPKAATSNSPA